METCHWNGNLIIATEIAANYETEKEIRKASGRKELMCPDPLCTRRTLRYCHGEKKMPFFAHLSNENCDYAKFDKRDTEAMKSLRMALYQHFKAAGFEIQPEVKLLEHHYTPLVIKKDGHQIAFEIGTQRISANKTDYLVSQYKSLGISVKWLIADNSTEAVYEDQTNFIKRFSLNESKNKDLVVVNWDGTRVTQYKMDPNHYEHLHQPLMMDGFSTVYQETTDIAALTFESGELTISAYSERYAAWVAAKQAAAQQECQRMDNMIQQRENRMQAMKKQQEERTATIEELRKKQAQAMEERMRARMCPAISNPAMTSKGVDIDARSKELRERLLKKGQG